MSRGKSMGRVEICENELKELCKPLIDYLYKKGSPHSALIITQSYVELMEGTQAFGVELRD